MLIRPTGEDFRIIGFYMGRVFSIFTVASMAPIVWAIAAREWHPFSSFVLMAGCYALIGAIGLRSHPKHRRLDWSHGMTVVALTWAVAPLVGSIPLVLAGHWGGPLDAYFDAMSGLTTTGLSLVQDLDHLASSINFWRHFLHFLGGQGIILAALSLFAAGGGLTLYYGEAREERILPSVTSTARFIWGVAIIHLIGGVAALTLVGWLTLGFTPLRSAFHGLMIFFAGFDTGGFAPQSTSLGYYHSAIFEAVTGVLMVAGAMSFGVHYALWRRKPGSVLRNLETRTIVGSVCFTLFLTIVGLAVTGIYTSVTGLARAGTFQVISAHTGTGFSTVSTAELSRWGGLEFGGVAIAMALGGMGSSTAGGVKALRIGLTLKAIGNQVKRVLLPDGAVVGTGYMQGSRKRLTSELAQSVMAVSLLYVALYLVGAGVGMAYGYSLQVSLFESVSAGANVGLSVGVTEPLMPAALKVVYMLQMWAGRLEFVAVFALIGFVLAWARGK